MGKRGPKPGHGGRPKGGKHSEEQRIRWRLRKQEQLTQNYAENAIKDFLDRTGHMQSVISLHKFVGNWENVRKTVPPSAWMLEWLIGIFQQRATELIKKKPERSIDLLKFALDNMWLLSTLQNYQSRFKALADTAMKLSEIETEVNTLMYYQDRLMAEWLQNLYSVFSGVWGGSNLEAESRETVITAFKTPGERMKALLIASGRAFDKDGKLLPFKPKEPQPHREPTPEEREAAKKRLRPVLEALENKKREENEKKKKEKQDATP